MITIAAMVRCLRANPWDDASEPTTADIADRMVALRAALLKFVDHFGPLEDNHMLHEDARACFRLAREALGAEEHDAAIKRALAG